MVYFDAACTKPWSVCAAPNIAPLNETKWNTTVASWSPDWSWDPAQVEVIGPLPTTEVADPMTGEIPDYSGYAAISMVYDEHVRDGKKVYYKAGIMKSTVPAGVTYGRFEARIKGASRWPGVCPAFWAYRQGSTHWTELDFAEMLEDSEHQGATPKDVDFTAHVFPPTPGVPAGGLHNSTHKVFDWDPRVRFPLGFAAFRPIVATDFGLSWRRTTFTSMRWSGMPHR